MDEILAEDTGSEDEGNKKNLVHHNVQAIPNSVEESSLEGDAKSLEDRAGSLDAGSLDFADQIAASLKLEREAQLKLEREAKLCDDVSTILDETFVVDKHSDAGDDQQERKDPDTPISDTQVDHHSDADDEREEKGADHTEKDHAEEGNDDEGKGELQFVPASYDESQERRAASKLSEFPMTVQPSGQDKVNPSPGSDINNLAHLQNYSSSNTTTTPPNSSNITASNFAPLSSASKVSGTPTPMKYFENSNKFIYEIDNSRILIGKLQEFREPSFSQDEDAIPDTPKAETEDTLRDLSTIPYVEETPTQSKDEGKPSGLLDVEEFSLTFDNTPPSSPKKPKSTTPAKPSTNTPLLQADDKPSKKRLSQRRFVDSNEETADFNVPLTTPRGPSSTTPTTAPATVSAPTTALPTTTTTTSSLPHTSQQTEGSQFSQMSQQPFVFTKPVTTEQETRENENEPSPKRRRVKRDSTSGKMLEPSSSSEEDKSAVQLDAAKGSDSEDDVFQQALARSKGKQYSTPMKSTAISDASGSSGKRNTNSITPPKQTKGGSKSITRIKTSPQDTQVMSQRSIRHDLKAPPIQHDSKQFKKKTVANGDDTTYVTPPKQKASSPWTKAKHKHDSEDEDEDDDFQPAAGKQYSPFSPSPVQSSPCIAVPLTSHNSVVPSNLKLQPKKLQFPLKRKAKDDSLTVYDLDSPVSQVYTRSSNSFFAGVTFIFTGLKTTKGQDSLGVVVESHGGQIGDFNSAPSPTETLRVTPYVILPSRFLVADKERRTLKYLLAVATGTPCIQPNWVKHCAEQGCVLPYVPYLLPVGYSLSREEILYITVPKCSILSGYLTKVIGADDFVNHWETVLRAAGAAIMKGFDSVKQCHVIISDPFPDQEYPKFMLFSPSIVSMISLKYKKLASASKVPIVSVEWVIQCLINQETQPCDGHPRFHYRYLRDHYSATGAPPATAKNAT